jgi:hypothetical protein
MRPRKYDMSDVWFLFAVGLPFVCILALILRFGNHTGLSILGGACSFSSTIYQPELPICVDTGSGSQY